MGVVFEKKREVGKGNKNISSCEKIDSHERVSKQLTRQSLQFLKSLNLKPKVKQQRGK